MEHYQCNSMGLSCGHPNDLPIEHFHGIPNEQPPNASPSKPSALPRKPCHGIPNDQSPIQSHRGHMGCPQCISHKASSRVLLWSSCQCKSMGLPCGHPNGIAIEHFHGIPNEEPQCKSMESQCITHRAMPLGCPMNNPQPRP